MSIELQIQSSILGSIAARAVQVRLRTTCFAPVGPIYIDHADVGTTPVEVVSAGAAVRLRVPIEVFVVRRDDVLAAPNAVPAGATTPGGTVIVVLEMAATGAVVSLRGVDVEFGASSGSLGASASAAKSVILSAVASPATVDLTNALNQLGAPVPSSSRVESIGNVVAIRLDPAGNGAEHLFPGHEWGLFMDGPTVERLARSKVPATLTSFLPSLTVTPHWRPAGIVPHVDVDYAGKVPVPDPFTASIDGTLGCDFSLTPTITKSLRTTVHWSLHVDLGDFVPGFIDDLVEHTIAGALNPTVFGGTQIGDHAFSLDSPLPDVSFGGARLVYASIMASAAGMTIGGPVRLPLDPGKDTVQPSVHAFGLPYRLDFCSLLAKTGSGAPSKTVSLSEVTTAGRVWLEGCGALCEVEVLSPGNWIMPYLTKPGDGTVGETQEIRIVIPSAVALGITKPVRLIVRTPRGVRLVDLGVPPPVQVDANGNVTNAQVDYIDDCLYIPGGPLDEYGINWGKDVGLDLTVVNSSLEDPGWATYLGAQRGIDVQLVSLSGLEPGELIQFRSRDHAADVTADHNGRAVVPVLLPLADHQDPASLVRVNRRSIVGRYTVRTAVFARQASLKAGRQHRLASSVDGKAVLTTEFDDHIDVHEIGQLGAPMLIKRESAGQQTSHHSRGSAEEARSPAALGAKDPTRHESRDEIRSPAQPSNEEVALNPQPLPPAEVGNPLLAERSGLPGIASLLAVPGFADSPIAFAVMADGFKLVLDLDKDGTPRVAGTFSGPIGPLEASGDWAFGVNPDRVSIYRVARA